MSNQLHWIAGLHHDGSALYVSNPLPKQGETVTIQLRVPKDAPKVICWSIKDNRLMAQP